MVEKPLIVVFFVSRNKDNRGKMNPDWHERSWNFVVDYSAEYHSKLQQKFNQFVAQGQPGEICRWYESINFRDSRKVVVDLQHFLLDHSDYSLNKLPAKIAGMAMNSKNALSKKWLFDYDDVPQNLDSFINDITQAGSLTISEIECYPTINGQTVITPHGFDTRKLLSDWPTVTLKRDAMLLIGYDTKN